MITNMKSVESIFKTFQFQKWGFLGGILHHKSFFTMSFHDESSPRWSMKGWVKRRALMYNAKMETVILLLQIIIFSPLYQAMKPTNIYHNLGQNTGVSRFHRW